MRYDFTGDRVCQKALLVSEVVQLFEFFSTRNLVSGEHNLWIEVDSSDYHFTGVVFGEMANGLVGIAFDSDLSHCCDGEESEHMTAR